MLNGNYKIRFVDHVAIGVGTGSVSTSYVSTSKIIKAASGFENTNYFYAITFGNNEVNLYNYSPPIHTI